MIVQTSDFDYGVVYFINKSFIADEEIMLCRILFVNNGYISNTVLGD
jgi:hypothetical protein